MRCQSAAARIARLDGFGSWPKTRFLSPNSSINFMMIDIRYERGVYLPRQDLWLDSRDAKRFAFVSHAHSDHIALHDEILVSERTARLMQTRLPGTRIEHMLPFGERRRVHGLDLILLPAGHIFGSAQLCLFSEEDTLLYTGDFKLRSGKSAEHVKWRQADTLIMETTFGRPCYRFPPTEQIINQVVTFCRETIDDGEVPVLLGYSLGKAQEILCGLEGAELIPMLHGSVYKMTRIYEQFGQSFCKFVRYDANDVAGKVLICPPSANRSSMLEKIPRKRVAMISGWAVDPNAVYRYQVDAAFPLSDHADYNDLIRYVDLVQPKRVFTLHGFAAEFARDLRDQGVEAWALTEENQMDLALPKRTVATGISRASNEIVVSSARSTEERQLQIDSEFREFAEVGEAIAATPAKLEKIRLLASYLGTLTRDQLPIATTYFTGRSFAQSDPRTLQVGGSIIYRAIMGAVKLSEPEFRRISQSHSDAGKTTFEALDDRTKSEPFSLAQSHDFFETLHRMRGPIAKTELLQSCLARLSAREGQYVVKILTGDLRIGLREGLVEEAIARAFVEPLDRVKEANMLLGDIGATAALALRKELEDAELSIFRPIKCMLATPEPTAEAVWKRFVHEGSARDALGAAMAVYIEDKFDGIRAQLHRSAQRVEIFSRDLRRISDQFPELAERARKFQRAEIVPAHSAAEIEQVFQQARRRLNEGLMIKDPESFYSPGRRGMFWFKLKKEIATLDVVVVAAELGHGKRNTVLSDYTFAVRDETTGELLPIGKAYSGLTDAEIAELTEHFKQNTIVDHGRYREVKPKIVLEIAFNSIQPSRRHASGLALRFPRIKAIRHDKNVDSIDTLDYARQLAAQHANSLVDVSRSA